MKQKKELKNSNKLDLIALPKNSSREQRLNLLVKALKKQGWKMIEETTDTPVKKEPDPNNDKPIVEG